MPRKVNTKSFEATQKWFMSNIFSLLMGDINPICRSESTFSVSTLLKRKLVLELDLTHKIGKTVF